MAKRKTLKCPKCSRKFSMTAHLARHVSSIHGPKRRTKKKGRARVQTRAKRMPRTNLAFQWMSLGRLSLEQLQKVIDAARTEARRRLKKLQAAFS